MDPSKIPEILAFIVHLGKTKNNVYTEIQKFCAGRGLQSEEKFWEELVQGIKAGKKPDVLLEELGKKYKIEDRIAAGVKTMYPYIEKILKLTGNKAVVRS